MIGSLSNGSMMPASAPKFSQVGSAVGGAGGATGAPAPADAPGNERSDANGRGVASESSDEDALSDPAAEAYGPGFVSWQDGSTRFAVDLAKIDRDGALTLKIPEATFKDTFSQVVAVAEANGGMLMNSETHSSDTGVLTLRIPADNFDRAFTAVSRLGEIRESSVTGKDVTSDYLDLRAHLKIAGLGAACSSGCTTRPRRSRARSRSTTSSSGSSSGSRTSRVELNYLDAQTSISTLKVTLSEREPEAVAQQQEAEVENPSLSRAFDRAVQGFLGVVATMIVGLGYLVPLGILAGIALLVVMLVRRRGRAAS